MCSLKTEDICGFMVVFTWKMCYKSLIQKHIFQKGGFLCSRLFFLMFSIRSMNCSAFVRLIDWDGLHDVLGDYCSPLGRQEKSICCTGLGRRSSSRSRGFDQAFKKQENCRRRWGVKRIAIPKKGRTPRPNSREAWVKVLLDRQIKL